MENYAFNFAFGNTSMENTNGASFEKQGLVPIIVFKVMKEFLLLLIRHIRWKHSSSQVVDKIYIPWRYGFSVDCFHDFICVRIFISHWVFGCNTFQL